MFFLRNEKKIVAQSALVQLKRARRVEETTQGSCEGGRGGRAEQKTSPRASGRTLSVHKQVFGERSQSREHENGAKIVWGKTGFRDQVGGGWSGSVAWGVSRSGGALFSSGVIGPLTHRGTSDMEKRSRLRDPPNRGVWN